jgi:spermidine dehydrogenase
MPTQKGKDRKKSSNTKKKNQLSEKEKQRLGLDRTITRRDFLKVMMVGAGSLMIPGCIVVSSDPPFNPISPAAPHAFIGGDTADGLAACHNFWWERFARRAEDTGEIFDLVVVGAGLGGLTAAFFYHQERPGAKILLLDNHADFGGDAQQNELTIKGQKIIVTQAGDYQWAINPEYKAVKIHWADLGIDLSSTSNLRIAPEASQDHIFMNGKWIRDF